MSQLIHLDDRLGMMVRFARENVNLADIGTDHAYLPIYELQKQPGIRAIASDIHQGPLETARRNAAAYGVASRIHFQKTDGLQNLPLVEMNIKDIYLCGMGGEMIEKILEESAYVRSEDVQLLLQPMTKQAQLRTYLAQNGFAILDEALSTDGKHIYQGIKAAYTGVPYTLKREESALGPICLSHPEHPIFQKLLAREIQLLQEKIKGRQSGGLPSVEEEQLLKVYLSMFGV